ncbi:MAG TPA: hypothetical protein VGJ96_03380, partial [Gemmatimonadaceae bacterium]
MRLDGMDERAMAVCMKQTPVVAKWDTALPAAAQAGRWTDAAMIGACRQIAVTRRSGRGAGG